MRKEREAVENERREAQAVLAKLKAVEAAQRREKEEAERIAHEAAQAPDLEKMRAYAAKIRAIEMPDILSKESVAQFSAFKKFLESALEILER